MVGTRLGGKSDAHAVTNPNCGAEGTIPETGCDSAAPGTGHFANADSGAPVHKRRKIDIDANSDRIPNSGRDADAGSNPRTHRNSNSDAKTDRDADTNA